MSASYADLELENLNPENNEPPKSRLKDASCGRLNFQTMLSADRLSAGKRAEVQAMLDGKPPLDQAMLVAKGQGARTNLNFGDAERIQTSAEASMIDLVNSLEHVVKVPLKYGVVENPEQKANYEEILAAEVSRTFRNWPNWGTNYQMVVNKWLAHGVGIGYFETTYDWRWEATGLGEFLIPRKTRASEEYIAIATCRRGYMINELYEKIMDPKSAEAMGWNVELTKQAILKCAQSRSNGYYTGWTWERLEVSLRNSDLSSGGRCEEVSLVHCWVKEFDQTVSMYIFTEDEPNEDLKVGFLYKKLGMFENMRQGFTFFPYGIGNGYYHGISGLMRNIYPHVQVSNRMRSLMVDAAAMSASIKLQPESETALDKLAFVSFGPMMLLPPADVANFVEVASPNLAQNVTPVLADMQNSLDQRAGQLNTDSPLNNGVEKTRYEMEALVSSRAKVGTAQLNLFYPPWGRLLKESTRRLCAPDYSSAKPGGKEAEAFRKRLEEQGFPLELLNYIDFEAVTCNRAVGAGSEAARFASLNQMEQMLPAMDAVGRHNFYRAKSASVLGSFEAVNPFFPPLPGDVRPPMDKQIADLENCVMELLKEVEVVVNQNHQVHLDAHLPVLDDYLQKVQDGQMDMLVALDPMSVIHAHCIKHLEQIEGDPILQDQVGIYRQALSNASEILWNATRKREAMQQKADQEGGQQGEEQGEQDHAANLDLVHQIAEGQAKLQMMAQEGQQKALLRQNESDQKIYLAARESAVKQQIKLDEANQDRKIKDAETAVEIIHSDRLNKVKAIQAAKAAQKSKPAKKTA